MKGILVIGHGSRSKDVKDTFFRIIDGMKERLKLDVEGCFMELCEPDIPSTIEKMYSEGAREITCIPYFLFNGIHIKEDIPEMLKEIKEKHDDLIIYMANPIDYHSLLIDILVERAEGDKRCI